jgi:hypothetical protein
VIENWKEISGTDGEYLVSDLGRVVSFKKGYRAVLKPGLSSNGYLSVCVNRKSRLIQHLVAEAFIGRKPEGFLVLHNNGNRTDNRAENIRYGSPSENNLDITRHGRRKLSTESIREIRALHEIGVPKLKLAEKFAVTRRQISNVVRLVQYGVVK